MDKKVTLALSLSCLLVLAASLWACNPAPIVPPAPTPAPRSTEPPSVRTPEAVVQPAQQEEWSRIQASGVLRVGCPLDNPPFNMYNADFEPDGFDVVLMAEIAERRGATVLMEPFFRGFLASAKRTRLYLEAVGSPRIRALLDPANLLEVNDLEEMFDQLGAWIDCLHAKDRKLHVDRGVPAGQGDLEYPKFVALAAKRTPSAPLILEYVGRDNYRQALAHLREAIRSA